MFIHKNAKKHTYILEVVNELIIYVLVSVQIWKCKCARTPFSILIPIRLLIRSHTFSALQGLCAERVKQDLGFNGLFFYDDLLAFSPSLNPAAFSFI